MPFVTWRLSTVSHGRTSVIAGAENSLGRAEATHDKVFEQGFLTTESGGVTGGGVGRQIMSANDRWTDNPDAEMSGSVR